MVAKAPEAGNSNVPEAETLKPRSETEKAEAHPNDGKVTHNQLTDSAKRRSLAYRPSHKATFIGLGVIVAILAVNTVVLGFLIKSGNNTQTIAKGVSLSPATLSKLGVSDTQIGNSNEKLIVDPNAQFNSQLTVGGDVNIGGQLHLNSTLVASNADLSQVQAGSATANTLNINGSATASTLSVRGNMAVNGAVQFQNTVTIAQLLSVNSSAAIANNLSVGGELSTNNIATGNLVVSSLFEVGTHIITAGRTPSIGPGGSALGSYGTVSLSGNDIAGTIAVNVGTGSSGPGIVARVAFANQYQVSPVVVITPRDNYAEFYISNVTTSGFDIYTANSLSPGGYLIDYLAEQ